MPSTWVTRPIFISSTFRDMQAERDCLRHFVFPELEERLRARRHFLEPIDLRLGVEGGDAARERVLVRVVSGLYAMRQHTRCESWPEQEEAGQNGHNPRKWG